MPHKHNPNSEYMKNKRQRYLNYLRTGFWKIECPQCGFSGEDVSARETIGGGRKPHSISSGTYCPNCGYERATATFHSSKRDLYQKQLK
jgi:rubredoxin